MFEGDLAEKRISVLSGGERSRVLLGKLLVSPSNLLLLDEPTNHLDVESVESLLEAIESFAGAVLIVTHSELILERVCNRLVIFDGGESRIFEGRYGEFLDRIGWADEADLTKGSRRSKQAVKKNPKEQRRERAKIMTERTRALAPLRRETEALEAEIVKLEAAVEKEHAELAKIANSGDAGRITELARASKMKQKRIDRAFDELEKVSEKIAQTTADFDKQLGT